MPLIVLVPMLLCPLPLGLLQLCGSNDAFSEKPKGTHWAEFTSSFLFTGCFAIPILLAVTKTIEYGAMGVSLAGTMILVALAALGVYFNRKDDITLSGF